MVRGVEGGSPFVDLHAVTLGADAAMTQSLRSAVASDLTAGERARAAVLLFRVL